MSLTLIETLEELSREQLELGLTHIRTERLRLQTAYAEANNARLSIERKKTKDAVTKQMVLLAKQLADIDAKIERAKERMQKINIMSNQVSHISSLLEEDDS